MRGVGGADVFLPSSSKAFQGKEEGDMDHADRAEGGLEMGHASWGSWLLSLFCVSETGGKQDG